MRFYNKQHSYYCGIDLHARTMYACVLDEKGEIAAQKNLQSEPGAFLTFIRPFRPDVAVAVECMFTWYWIADLCEEPSRILLHA